jgi:hypothetical protein
MTTTTHHFDGLIPVTAPDPYRDDLDDYPTDEWSCRDCEQPVGFHLWGDHGGGWIDHYLVPDTEDRLCDGCAEAVTTEPDYPEPPACSDCGRDADLEHTEDCPTTVPHGCLTVGTYTRLGKIEQVSLTAYKIEGVWFPFTAIHGPHKPVDPLVSL